MSVMITNTCRPSSTARYSAAVSAKRGVSRRCVEDSLAKLRNIAVWARAPDSSMSWRDIAREAGVRQAAAGEQGQLLSAYQAVHEIDGGDAGFDEIGRQFARGRI